MNFESALAAMKHGSSVRRSHDRYSRTRYYLNDGGRFVEHGDTKDAMDVTVIDDRIFLRDELLAEDWEIVDVETETTA